MNGDEVLTLVTALADLVSQPDPGPAALVTGQLTGLDGRGWLRLDELARRPYWSRRRSSLDDVADWERPLAAGTSLPVLVAASMARDGHVREAAVPALALIPGHVAAAALAVRVTDWVPEVGAAAQAAVAARTGTGDAAAIVPVMLALTPRKRGQHAAAAYLASVAAGPAATLQALAAAGERAGRLWALDALRQRNLLTDGALAGRAMRDPDPVVALWCARSLAGPPGTLPAAGAQLLASARARVRAYAAGHLSDGQLTRPALRELLLDRSALVRFTARWRWRQQYGDPAPVYRSALSAPARPSEIVAALLGLDEDGDEAMPAVAAPFLTHRSPRVRHAAALVIGHRADAQDVVDLLVPLLDDPSAKVAAAALRQLHGYALPARVVAGLHAAGTPRARRMALSLQQHSGSWARVHADLAAINGPDRDLGHAARADLLAWLHDDAATAYGQPDAGQARDIARFLATSGLSDSQRREIAFVAGIRGPVGDPPPG